MITPSIEQLNEKKLVGQRTKMSLAHNKTAELWSLFMPRRNEIKNALSNNLFSLNVYPGSYFANFSPNNPFEKWAAVEVDSFDAIPSGMEGFMLPLGLYAIFHYKGLSTDNSIFQYIFGVWLPASVYVLDDRPHFELLGELYKNNDPSSEEDIWIPIRPKAR